MFLHLLQVSLPIAIAWLIAVVLSLTIHEFSHALVGRWRGDKTAEFMGRLTLNPIAHLDPLGFVFLLLFGFGWAKPVPFNPYNLKNPKWDSVLVAFAGPISNLLLAIVAALALRGLAHSAVLSGDSMLGPFLFLLILLNLFLMFFNLVPVHPLDGSKLFFALFDAPQYAKLRFIVGTYGPQMLFVLALLTFALPSFNPFFFVSGPAYAVCGWLLGQACQGF